MQHYISTTYSICQYFDRKIPQKKKSKIHLVSTGVGVIDRNAHFVILTFKFGFNDKKTQICVVTSHSLWYNVLSKAQGTVRRAVLAVRQDGKER